MKYAEIQNKPCPFAPREPVATIKQADGTSITSELETIVPTEVASPVSSFSMRIIKQSRVMDLQGSVCVFHIDTSNAIVEMREGDGGVVTGIIDVTSIPAFVRELQEIAQMVQGLEG